jgi:hypothetical protein
VVIDYKIVLKRRSKAQIEFNANYPLANNQRKLVHAVDAYLFVPKNLGINQQTYPSYLFYRDLQSYSELLPERLSLSELTAQGNHLLHKLQECIDNAQAGDNEQDLQVYETSMRTFCRRVKTAIDIQLQEALNSRGRDICSAAVTEYLQLVPRLLQDFRRLEPSLPEAESQPHYMQIFLLCDEYLSLLCEESSCRLAHSIKHRNLTEDTDPGEALQDFALGELHYRIEREYPSVTRSKGHNEQLVYRQKSLRTYVESVFFVSTTNKPESRLARELLLSMAAGIAMVFATAAAFFAQVEYGNWTATFFMILVISYMGKDRIKALTQDYLKTRGQRLFFDFRKIIYGQTTRKPLGIQRESFSFIPASELDPEILRVRNRDVLAGLDNDYCGEHTILYKRRGKLYPQRLLEAFANTDIAGIRQIMHFDLTRFTRKMENSKSRIYVPDEDGYHKSTGRLAYHLHLIINFASDDVQTLKHYRIVISNDGIHRIEEIEDQTENDDEQTEAAPASGGPG